MDDANQTGDQPLELQHADRPPEAAANGEAYFLCPFCGGATRPQARCEQCKGFLDPLSRQATQNVMGPWFIRDQEKPYRPGCNFETLAQLVSRGHVDMRSILRGPTTNQFWMPARRTPGVANLLGLCHACAAPASPDMHACGACHAEFPKVSDRQGLGLLPVRPLPGQSSPDAVAAGVQPGPRADRARPAVDPPRPRDAETAEHGASQRMAARLEAVERQSRVLGAWLAVSLVVVFAAGALILAGFVSGVLTWSSEPGATSPDDTRVILVNPARPKTNPESTPESASLPDATPAKTDPAAEPVAEPAAPEKAPPATPESSQSDPVIDQARALMQSGTKESLAKAIEILDRETTQATGDRLELIKRELRAAKAMQTAADLKGAR